VKKILFAAALLMISASAQARTYHIDGVTVHVQRGCRSSSCVSVSAPAYGYYHMAKAGKVQKDQSRFVPSTEKPDAVAPATATPTNEAAKPADAPVAKPADAAPTKVAEAPVTANPAK